MDHEMLRSRFRGAMLGVLIGDAFGADFEAEGRFARSEVDEWLRGNEQLRYTDDAHMTMALAESLLERGSFDGAHMTSLFAERYFAEPWRGYAPGPPKIFERVRDGTVWNVPAAELFGGTGSLGNGGAMRVTPTALFGYPDLARIADLAGETARVTHTHPLGVEGAIFQACAVGWLLQQQNDRPVDVDALLHELRSRVSQTPYLRALEQISDFPADPPIRLVWTKLGNGVEARRSVPTALWCFVRSPQSFVETISYAVSLGGDTDTIASMAGALSGAYLGEGAIPASLVARTEGVTQMLALADRLYERTCRQ